MTTSRTASCSFVPPWLLEQVGASDTLATDAALRSRREEVANARRPAEPLAPGAFAAQRNARSALDGHRGAGAPARPTAPPPPPLRTVARLSGAATAAAG